MSESNNQTIAASITASKYSDNYNVGENSKPLIMLLHGWGSNEHDLPGLVDVLDRDAEYVALRAPFSADSPGIYDGGYAWGYAWFIDPVVAHNQRSEQAKLAGDAIIKWLNSEQESGKINPNRPLIILGFSQGGAMVTHLLLRPELKERLVGAIMLSGYLPFNVSGDSDNISVQNQDLPIFHGWGDADDIVPPVESIEAKQWFADNFNQTTDKTYANMMHSICLEEVDDLRSWLKKLI